MQRLFPLTEDQFAILAAAEHERAEAEARLNVLINFAKACFVDSKGGIPVAFRRDALGPMLILDFPEEGNGQSESGADRSAPERLGVDQASLNATFEMQRAATRGGEGDPERLERLRDIHFDRGPRTKDSAEVGLDSGGVPG